MLEINVKESQTFFSILHYPITFVSMINATLKNILYQGLNLMLFN